MGYASFAYREIMLVNQISNMEYMMTTLMMQMQSLANQASIMADGVITSDEKRGLFDFKTLKGLNAIEANGLQRKIARQEAYEKNKVMTILSEEYKEEIQNRVHRAEKNVEMQIRRLETQLSAKRKDLESVQRGKDNAIKQATPKYGL